MLTYPYLTGTYCTNWEWGWYTNCKFMGHGTCAEDLCELACKFDHQEYHVTSNVLTIWWNLLLKVSHVSCSASCSLANLQYLMFFQRHAGNAMQGRMPDTPRDLCWQAVIQEDVRTIDLRPVKDADHEFPSSLTHFPSWIFKGKSSKIHFCLQRLLKWWNMTNTPVSFRKKTWHSCAKDFTGRQQQKPSLSFT